MRRNDNVFLVGAVVHSKQQMLRVAGEPTPALELHVLTHRADQGGRHRVFVTGCQGAEVFHFLQASAEEPLEVMVLGWLQSFGRGSVVVAGRVTAVAPRQVRERAVEALRQEGIASGTDRQGRVCPMTSDQ